MSTSQNLKISWQEQLKMHKLKEMDKTEVTILTSELQNMVRKKNWAKIQALTRTATSIIME